jgi:bifunctional ADP-heptose synthase (sugar kinase/adenylyltransferase)
MLSDDRVEYLLARIPGLTIGILGDLFLDRYLDIDAGLTEKSIETGLDAYQVTRVRSNPGAAGTVINNLAALGVQRVIPVSVIGDDGEGYELRQALKCLQVVDAAHISVSCERRTPTYTKPMLREANRAPRELNRLDIKNRTPMPGLLEEQLIAGLRAIVRHVDALLVLDQVSEEDCGVVTTGVRAALAREAPAARFILADSRVRIEQFRSICVMPNSQECLEAGTGQSSVGEGARALALRVGGLVFCTQGEKGIWVASPHADRAAELVPAYPVSGPIDIVGAGDSTSAGIACAIAGGATPVEAAAFGNLIASITIQQIGTTGTATPAQVRKRWREVREQLKQR